MSKTPMFKVIDSSGMVMLIGKRSECEKYRSALGSPSLGSYRIVPMGA